MYSLRARHCMPIMTVCMTHALAEARSASVGQGNAVARVTMGKVAARSKGEKTDACVMCKKQDVTFRAPHAMTPRRSVPWAAYAFGYATQLII